MASGLPLMAVLSLLPARRSPMRGVGGEAWLPPPPAQREPPAQEGKEDNGMHSPIELTTYKVKHLKGKEIQS